MPVFTQDSFPLNKRGRELPQMMGCARETCQKPRLLEPGSVKGWKLPEDLHSVHRWTHRCHFAGVKRAEKSGNVAPVTTEAVTRSFTIQITKSRRSFAKTGHGDHAAHAH
ncbi:hypothetical protein J6590_020698 [Homalodisca vitripennis]|nr:hypothetical protein J6590_020698 [Homalodisca vitripennis]